LCPITEANLGDGTFNAVEFRDRGGAFGIGSDSNVLIGVTDELRQLEYSQRLAHRARNVVAGTMASTGRTLFEGALQGGSQALGVATPGLTKGGFADIVSLDAEHVALASRSGDAILDSWIFGAGRSPMQYSTAGFSAPAVHWSIASGRGATRSYALAGIMTGRRSRCVFVKSCKDCWPHEL
jgi:cytosine/adenosine deaminase-related metal-dependent hydrolase